MSRLMELKISLILVWSMMTYSEIKEVSTFMGAMIVVMWVMFFAEALLAAYCWRLDRKIEKLRGRK